jgi:hypothetical protein
MTNNQFRHWKVGQVGYLQACEVEVRMTHERVYKYLIVEQAVGKQ